MKEGNGVKADDLWRTLSAGAKSDPTEDLIDRLRGSQLGLRLAVRHTIKALKPRAAKRLAEAMEDVLAEMRPKFLKSAEEDGPRIELRSQVFLETLDEVVEQLRQR